MLHIYFGDGKGKTTAAAGLCVRYSFYGRPVFFCQFLKSAVSGEAVQLQLAGVKIYRCEKHFPFTFNMDERQRLECAVYEERLFKEAAEAAEKKAPCLLVLDEVIDAIEEGLLAPEPVLSLAEKAARAPDGLELVMTGRRPGDVFVSLADYMTEFKKRKHPYDKGTGARKGIEF